MTLSSRIGVMRDGRIVQTGTPNEIYEYPASRFVADFIGSVNIFAGRVAEEDSDHVIIESAEAGQPLFIDHGIASAPEAQVWVAVRPEKVNLTRADPKLANNVAQGVVQNIAYMGDLSVYQIRLDSGKLLRVTQPNQHRHADDRVTWDERVYVHWHPGSCVVLMS